MWSDAGGGQKDHTSANELDEESGDGASAAHFLITRGHQRESLDQRVVRGADIERPLR